MRTSGILLHPSSLPSKGAIGTLGQTAFDFIDALADAGQSWWQILPLGPTGYGDSPYMATSAFAGNPLLIDAGRLAADGLVGAAQVPNDNAQGRIVWEHARAQQDAVLDSAWAAFQQNEPLKQACAAWAPTQGWLDEFAVFTALSRAFGDVAWTDWPAPLRDREAAALAEARQQHADAIARVVFEQFVFDRQWRAVKAYANGRGIGIIGDLPIFVSFHSADVWAHRALFQLADDGQPTVIAGVPPDYFSPTGQRWGNPLYRWDALADTDYAWWVERFRALFGWVDCVRVDHFRGFEAYWEIPAAAETAIDGKWVKGPGRRVFDAIREQLGALNIIAEDLGIITDEVTALREGLGFPGMKVLQFGLGDDPSSPHAPGNVTEGTVVYTGTHDNNTTLGWYEALSPHEQHLARVALGREGRDIAWEVMAAAWNSPAQTAIAPAQDVLRLGADHRMNIPGVAAGNWAWRMQPGAWTPVHSEHLRDMTQRAGRLSKAHGLR